MITCSERRTRAVITCSESCSISSSGFIPIFLADWYQAPALITRRRGNFYVKILVNILL